MNGQFAIGGLTPARYFFTIAVVLGLLFAMISDEPERPVALVFFQWQLQTLVPMALLIGSHIGLLRLRAFGGLNPWFGLLLSGVVGASLFAPVALAIDLWLEAPSPDRDLFAELVDEWLSVTPPVTLCWIALNAPWQLGFRLQRADGDVAVDGPVALDAADNAEFMQLVADERRGRLLYLKSELHYLQVVTDRGSSLILYNLADAIEQLPARAGIQVHRSYWVARDAIEKLERRGRQGELLLRDGHRVPVSRQRLAAVSAMFESS